MHDREWERLERKRELDAEYVAEMKKPARVSERHVDEDAPPITNAFDEMRLQRELRGG